MTIPTTSSNKSASNGGTTAKPGTPPPVPPTTAAAGATTTPATAPEKKRTARQVFIIPGDVLSFKNAAEAEKFLNTDADAPKTFTVIKGTRIEKTQKVSLR